MTPVQQVATVIIEVSKLISSLAGMLERADDERFDAATARAEIQRMFDDVRIDEAIERRDFERLRAERNGGK